MIIPIWIIILISAVLKRDLTDALGVDDQQFRQAKCIQTKSGVHCEDNDYTEEQHVSNWPPGSYSIPMPISGCPEASNKGWGEGYISFTWKVPHAVYVANHNNSDVADTSDILSFEASDITEDNWPEIGTQLLGPFRKYVFRLNFCHKQRRNKTIDIGVWPDGNYSIYGDHSGCPTGFSSNNMTIYINQIEVWTSGGHVPDFVIEEENDSATLRLFLCSRDSIPSESTPLERSTDLSNSPFVLLKNSGSACPRFDGSVTSEENMFLDGVPENHTQRVHVKSYCFYMPIEWNTDEYTEDVQKKLENTAYLVSTSYLLEGNKTVNPNNQQQRGHDENILNMIETQVQTSRYVHWKLIDLGRTISVAAIWINLPSGSREVDPIPTCFIGEEKWCFLHMCSYICFVNAVYKTDPSTLQLLFLRPMSGRYIALDDPANNIVHVSTGIEVFTDSIEFDGQSDCNTDLGMTDGGILDFQISASSYHLGFLPSHSRPYHNGWCAQSSDQQPYIQVDLLVETTIEGVSVWNWQKRVTTISDVVWDTIVHVGVDTLKVYLGKKVDTLLEYNQVFHFDRTRPIDEAQTFWFFYSITARFVRLEIAKPITEDLNCLRFELHGCRISGIPSLKCPENAEMFHLMNVPISPQMELGIKTELTFGECENACLQSSLCSSVSFTSSNKCTIYRNSKDEIYTFVQVNNASENWSTKLCYQDQFITGSTLTNIQGSELSNANIKEMKDEGIITSPEFPFSYQSGLNHKWVISFEPSNFVKIVFTNISLHRYEDSIDTTTSCTDSVVISKYIRDSLDVARVLDSRFNGALSVIETSESVLVITFKTCLPFSRRSLNGHGFRAIVTKNDVPACFTLDSKLSWETGREETCTMNRMSLTSMSLLGLPFSGTTERWEITTRGQRILIHILDFQVACKTDDTGSEFLTRDLGIENTYCNLKKPPAKIYSLSDTVLVSFYKGEDPPYITFKEGFRLIYYSERVSMDYLISYQAHRSNLTNVALGKPAIMSSLYIYQSRDFLAAGKATDGTVHLDAAWGACFHTKSEFEPWWMVDLQGIYIIDRIVLYNKQENAAGVLARNIEISVGVDVGKLRVTSYLCGSMEIRKTFDQNNVKGRYVKLQVKHLVQKFHLCEVEVYGNLEFEIDEKLKKDFPFPKPVQGNWGNWGSWSNLCYCNGKQPRTRLCDNPAPSFGGSECAGSNIMFRKCIPSDVCNVTNVALEKPASTSSSEYAWSTANLSTDGSTLQSQLSCFQTKFEYQPWWIIDLQGVFELEKMTLYRRADCCPKRARNIEISVGVSCDMKTVYSACGKHWGIKESVSLIGSAARYVKIQLIEIKEYLNLCEIEIFGQPAKNDTVGLSDVTCNYHSQVDGQYGTWSQWSSCSEKCGIGKMTRTRLCDYPPPSDGGRNCFGDDTETKNCVGKGSCPICSETLGKCYSLIPKLTNWKQAGFECWRRKMKLVSVRTKTELRFIKYLLREHRYSDKQPIAKFDSVYRNASYFTHIGLYRYSTSEGKIIDMWEDKTPVTFTAWKSGEPSNGNCVRMNYKSFEDIRTWESEDCQSVVAEYFICEQHIRNQSMLLNDEEMPELHGRDWAKIPEQITSSQYTGKANTTMSGQECISWDKQANDQYSIIWWQVYIDRWWYGETKAEAKNYCRDPSAENHVWCNYKTSDNITKRQECSVLYPVVENTQNYDWRYMGKWNKTYTGKTCQHWNVKFPHGHYSTGYNFPGETMNSVENYCRDIWDSGYLWCYTIEQDMRWELCIVEDNPDDRCTHTHNIYSGNWNKSYSGRNCSRWDQNQKYLARGFDDLMFPDKSITAAENFCRDPMGVGYLWCYVNEIDVSWEPCIFDEFNQLPTFHSTADILEEFVCGSGEKILQNHVCDDKFDCVDLSDETECLYIEQTLTDDVGKFVNNPIIPEAFVLSSHFQCGTDEWIPVTARCDEVKDCLDATDELNCGRQSERGTSVCSSDQFRCDDGDCIHISQVCNFVDDCIDGSDEYCDIDECRKSEYRCGNGQCISLGDRCNGFPDCMDGSDEKFCDTCHIGKAFHCDIVKCIPSRLVCDKYRDCKDGSDETSCSKQDFTSCEQWWEAGYRKTGPYTIGGLTADCDFDSVISEKKMYTIIRNFDILWRDGDGVGYLYTRDTLREEDVRLEEILKRPNYNCVQKVTQSCIPSHETAAEFDDYQHENHFKHCECFEMTIHIGRSSKITHCDKNKTDTINQNNLIFSYNASLSLYRKIVLKSNQDFVVQGYQIVPGETVCEYNYDKLVNLTTCEGDVKEIPSSMNCLYDIDAAGYSIGCRSGSHLQNCENHDCQDGTVKCPASYCIPLRFVCDGEVQCPGGQDEEGCGCEDNANEVLILYDAESKYNQTLDIYKFAKQFSTATNTIRTLSFVASQPLQDFNIGEVVLQITDKVIQPMTALNRLQECRYNIMAKSFIKDIHISAQTTRGIIYIQDSDISKALFKTLFNKISSNELDLTVYRVMEHQMKYMDLASIPLVTDLAVRRWGVLNAVGAEFFPEFCRARTKIYCPNRYKCKWSKMCIPLNQVCDGHAQCKHGDDEQLCNFICPEGCSCVGYRANCSDSSFNSTGLRTIPVTTRQLDLSFNKEMENVLTSSYLDIMVLVALNLSSCSIDDLSRFAFLKVKNLVNIDLSFNSITIITKGTFSYLKYLRVLRLDGNWDLATIQPGAFDALSNIHDLNFAGARLAKIKGDTFSGLVLQSIDLSNNSIKEIEDFAFRGLAVKRISFEQNQISLFRKEIFTGVEALETLRTPAFKFCCIRPSYLQEEDCFPPKDEFSSCEDLMRLSALQTMLWLIGLSALVGNALTILYRLKYDRARLKLGFGIFVTNLAAADLLMGVYLLIIAVADAVFRKRYIFMDEYWRNSAWCNLAGVLSTISSEASVFFLCLITIDRLFVIKFPFGQIRFDKRKSVVCAGSVWFCSIFLAVLPVLYESYFQNKFYTKSGVCIALPLTRDRPPGWVYSVAIFVGLNFATFVLVAFGQWSIFMEIRKASGGMENASAGRKNDLKVARNLLLVVLTDFLCWFPIGVMGMMALYGHVISGDVYAWSAVFILPINSALNPILYTVSSIIGRKKFNPNTEEQSRTEMTKEFGANILNFQRVSRHFSVRNKQTSYKSISSVLHMEEKIKPIIIIKAVKQLAKCLEVLHSSSLVIGDLNINNVCLSVSKNRVTGDVQIEREPRISNSTEDAPGDMFQVGKIVRVLLSKCRQRGD